MESVSIARDTNIKKTNVNISVVGIGKSGMKILKNLSENKFDGVNYFCLINKNYPYVDEKNIPSFYFDINQNINDENLIIEENCLIIEKIKIFLQNTKVLILTSGLGGSTTSKIVKLITSIAKEMQILTISLTTSPFLFEGSIKQKQATICFEDIKKCVDAFACISNDKLLSNYPDITMLDAYKLTNNTLKKCINSLISINLESSIININFENIYSLLSNNKKEIYIGFGSGIGRHKIKRAIHASLDSKAIELSIKNDVQNLVVNIITDPNVSIKQINEIIDEYKKQLNNDEINVLFGFGIDKKLRNEIQISVIATFRENELKQSIIDLELEDKKNHETLVKIGNTLELELTGEKAIDLNFDDLESKQQNHPHEEVDDEEATIQFDDDIPFFLK